MYVPGGFQVTTLIQAESARPITLTTPVDVNGLGDPTNDRAVINGVQTTLDQFRGTPYFQVDLRVARPFKVKERWEIYPFVEFFNLFNRNNPGANYVTDISALPTPVNNLYNATALCPTPACDVPITNPKATAGSGRRPGRLLRTGNDGGHSVRRPARGQSDVLGGCRPWRAAPQLYADAARPNAASAFASLSCTSKTVYSLVICSRSWIFLVKCTSFSSAPWLRAEVKALINSPTPELST